MLEIRKESDRFQATIKDSLSKAMTLIKVGFFDFEILETHQQINRESSQEDCNTIIDVVNSEVQEHSIQNGLQINKNRSTPHPNSIASTVDVTYV